MSAGFILDTNIPSELMRPRPESRVRDWVADQDIATLFLSVVSVGELESGFTTTLDAEQRRRFEAWLERHLELLFRGRVLPVTQAIAERWGQLDGMRRSAGRPLNTADGMIAATALEYDLAIVTRNTKDFDGLGVAVINPWLTS